MTRNVHQKGAPRRLEVIFENIAGTEQDPVTVALFVTNPAGVTTEYGSPDVVNDPAGTGAFYCDVPVPTSGEWHYLWEGSGASVVEATKRGEFIVPPHNFVVPP